MYHRTGAFTSLVKDGVYILLILEIATYGTLEVCVPHACANSQDESPRL